MDNQTDLTTILTTGSVTTTTGEGRTFQRIIGSGVWDTNGFSYDNSVIGAVGQVFYFSARPISQNSLVGLATSQTLSQSAMIGFGFPAGAFRSWSGVGFGGASIPLVLGIWYDCMMIVMPNGDIHTYGRKTRRHTF